MFTNTTVRLWPRLGLVTPVTVMMEAWQVCFFVLIVDFASGRDIRVNSTYLIKKTDSCPDVGYYFRRDPSPNGISPGPCYLCFCQNNGTAVCWERDNKRCDVEKYHHHRVGRRHSRYRRSPGLSDIFFRDASRDFLKTKLPQECKPTDPSFSDGCPPADWCIGCTICDCDANGRWDCHILSFCDGKHHQTFEKKKKKVKTRNVLASKRISKISKRTIVKNSSSKPRPTSTSSTTTKPPVKKVYKTAKQRKPQNKTHKKHQNKLVAKKKTNQPPKKQAVRQQAKKPYKMRLQPKRQPQRTQSRNIQRKHQPNVSKVKLFKKNGTARKAINLKRANKKKGIKLSPDKNDTLKLGKKIVKQVLISVQKMLSKMNATRVQRSITHPEGKGCGGLKKSYKTINNVMSDAVARNINKYKKLASINDNYNYRRFKRDIVDKPISKTENVSVIAISDNNAVIPLATVKPQNGPSNNLSTDVSYTTFSTPQPDTYYKYSSNNDVNGTGDFKFTTITTEPNKSDISQNLVIPDKPKTNVSNNVVDINETAVMPDSDNLTFTKWYIITVKTDRSKKPVKRLLLPKIIVSENKTFEDVKTTDGYLDQHLATNLQRKDVVKKYEFIKKHDWNNQNFTNYSRQLSSEKTPTGKSKPRITGINTILSHLFREVNNTEHKFRLKTKSKITSLVKYIRKFFRHIFSKKKTRTHKAYGIGTKEDHTLHILCENIGSCKINRKNKFILKYKLKRLNEETITILKSIKIIKHLLQMLDLPKCNRTDDRNKSHSFTNDVRKLNIIIRDNFNKEQINVSLTDTQMTQINYIKMNIQTFVESVKKFSDILNETIAMIKPKTENDISPRFLPKQSNNTIPLYKIKKMLFKYNIIQNTFIKNMYEFINRVENNTTTERIQTQLSALKKNRTQNHDEIVEKYSRNIIENLRRLKNIAAVLSSTRKKRNIRAINDNALEFLLTLMEYMIKPNHPLDNIRGNDGIDFLIDAIKNAPDIKITKNNLNYNRNKSTSIQNTDADLSDQLTEEGVPEIKRISKEEKQMDIEDNLLRNPNVWQADRATEAANDETTKVYFRVFNVRSPIYDEKISETTTENKSITKKRSSENKEKTGLDKFESSNEESNKYEVYTGDVEDDVGAYGGGSAAASNSTESNKESAEEPTTTLRPKEITTIKPIVKRKDLSSESQELKNDGKITKFDWIEAQFDSEIKEFNNATESDPIKTAEATQPTPTATTSGKKQKNADNKSDVTAEIEGNMVDSENKSHSKLTRNDIMHEKQMEFLNSLDYGTEKSENEEKDSKDDVRTDDGSPAYFI